MNRALPIIGLFGFSQFLLWAISLRDHIINGEEILYVSLVIGTFLGIFFKGYNWARWVAGVLLTGFGVIVASVAFEGFGISFLLIAVLYGLIIFLLFKMERPKKQSNGITHSYPDIIDSHFILKEPHDDPADADAHEYPLLLRRYQSTLIDSLIVFGVMVLAMVLIGESLHRQTVMISLAAMLLLFYEPVLTTYSATIGQRIMGIRVRSVASPDKRINIFQSYIRVLVKWSLGWLSFISINFNRQRRALHDIAGSSVVVKIK